MTTLVAGLAVYTAVWFWACARLEHGVEAQRQAAEQQGWSIHAGPPVRTGWPFAAALVLPSVSVSADPAVVPGGLTWTADRVRIELALADRTHLHVLPEGLQSVRLQGLPPLSAHAARIDLALAVDRTAPPLVTAEDLHLDLPAWPATLAHLSIALPPDGAVLEASGLSVPDALGGAISPTIGRLRARALLTTPIPAGATPAEQARSWRAAGGTLDIAEIAMQWGQLDLSGHATIRLDPVLQPDGEGVVAASGLAPSLDSLARAGVMPAGSATAAKAVLALIATPSPGAPVSLPVQIRGGVLSVARFPLLRVPRLDWGPG